MGHPRAYEIGMGQQGSSVFSAWSFLGAVAELAKFQNRLEQHVWNTPLWASSQNTKLAGSSNKIRA